MDQHRHHRTPPPPPAARRRRRRATIVVILTSMVTLTVVGMLLVVSRPIHVDHVDPEARSFVHFAADLSNQSSVAPVAAHLPVIVAVNQTTVAGLHGRLRPDALLTMIVTPKPLTDSDESRRKMKFAMRSWARLHRVDVVVMSSHYSVMKLAGEMGLATFVPIPGTSDLEAATYRHAFNQVSTVIPSTSPLVGFCNGDIMFDSSLGETLEAIISGQAAKQQVFIVGERHNVNVTATELVDRDDDGVFRAICARAKAAKTMGGFAEDYFIFSRGIDIDWNRLPPLMIGGVYFDNWLTSFVGTKADVIRVDASSTVLAMHINHGSNPRLSHSNLPSKINTLLAAEMKLTIKEGSTRQLKTYTSRSDHGKIVLLTRW